MLWSLATYDEGNTWQNCKAHQEEKESCLGSKPLFPPKIQWIQALPLGKLLQVSLISQEVEGHSSSKPYQWLVLCFLLIAFLADINDIISCPPVEEWINYHSASGGEQSKENMGEPGTYHAWWNKASHEDELTRLPLSRTLKQSNSQKGRTGLWFSETGRKWM